MTFPWQHQDSPSIPNRSCLLGKSIALFLLRSTAGPLPYYLLLLFVLFLLCSQAHQVQSRSLMWVISYAIKVERVLDLIERVCLGKSEYKNVYLLKSGFLGSFGNGIWSWFLDGNGVRFLLETGSGKPRIARSAGFLTVLEVRFHEETGPTDMSPHVGFHWET
ncbi:hypothetical protein BC828DRAFT_161343 [Blastocladiella britannica]|nr:hypothetical protein BC828DRAFT_161343 [Blastocladiella britannica]